jgi:hypothetical protein
LNPRPSGAPPLIPARYDDEARALKVLDQALGDDLRHEFVGIADAGRSGKSTARMRRAHLEPLISGDAWRKAAGLSDKASGSSQREDRFRRIIADERKQIVVCIKELQ